MALLKLNKSNMLLYIKLISDDIFMRNLHAKLLIGNPTKGCFLSLKNDICNDILGKKEDRFTTEKELNTTHIENSNETLISYDYLSDYESIVTEIAERYNNKLETKKLNDYELVRIILHIVKIQKCL